MINKYITIRDQHYSGNCIQLNFTQQLDQ